MKGVRCMNNSYLSRMNNVGYNQMLLQVKREYCKLMSKQIQRKILKLEEEMRDVYQQILTIVKCLIEKEIFHSLNLLKKYLNLLRIRKIVLLQIQIFLFIRKNLIRNYQNFIYKIKIEKDKNQFVVTKQ